MSDLDLTTTQYTVLVATAEKDGLSQQEIIDFTGIDRSTVSQVVQLLIRKGLVKRRRTRTDARTYAVSLTEYGCDVLKTSEQIVGRVEEAWCRRFRDRAKAFIANLRAIVGAFESPRFRPGIRCDGHARHLTLAASDVRSPQLAATTPR
jgi:DNA-binding MarR family transcriptional regulator